MGSLPTGSFLWKVRLILINTLVFAGVYGLLELSYSTYAYFFRDASPFSYLVIEHPGETVRFDADRGFFLTETPSRMARITLGRVEYVGPFHGNAEGFADRENFSVRRRRPDEVRIGVFGDSFTAATFEPSGFPNWPARAEDVGRSKGESLTLLNFALDGGGLANWASVMRNIVIKDRYDLDGLIFAVAWDDLYRKFAMFEQTDAKTFAYAQTPDWDVNAQPRTEAEADALLRKHPMRNHYVLSPAQFDAAVSGKWRPRLWRFRITDRLINLAETLAGYRSAPWQAPASFDPGQLALMREIRSLAEQYNLPIIVAYIPFRDELIIPGYPSSVDKSRQFAEILGAKFIDGREAFRDFSARQIRELWFPYDGHWNHVGSNRFADYMVSEISTWAPLKSHSTTVGGSRKANHPSAVSSRPPALATDQNLSLHHAQRASIAR